MAVRNKDLEESDACCIGFIGRRHHTMTMDVTRDAKANPKGIQSDLAMVIEARAGATSSSTIYATLR